MSTKFTPSRWEIADKLVGSEELDNLLMEYIQDVISKQDFMVNLNALIAVTEENLEEPGE